jgi:hypothetical protein
MMSPLRRAVMAAALRRARRWRRRADVLAVGVGQRRRQGRWIDDQTCIVVKVAWKLDAGHLARHGHAPLPRRIEVTIGQRRYRVAVDVQETRGEVAGRCQGCAGGSLTINSALRGGVAAIVSDGGETKILIAGHVGKRAGVTVQAGTVTGRTEAPVMNARADHCLVVPRDGVPPDAATLVDGTRLHGVVSVGELAVGQTMYFHRAATGRRTPVVLRHLDISAPFEYPDGIRDLEHLLATDGSTVAGDSGTLLFDSSFRAAGTLVGLFGNESYFIPCERAFPLLGIALIT